MTPDLTQRTITYRRVVHLSHTLHPQIPRWPEDPSLEFETVADIPSMGYFLRRFSMGEHSGTHLNAPRSFYPEGLTIDAYPAESLVAPAIVFDLRPQVNEEPDYQLTLSDITRWENQHGLIPSGSLVLLYTGWQMQWSNPAAFFNADATGQLHFPGFGDEAVHFLLTERQIAGVGIDTHGVDSGQDTTFAINKQVLAVPRLVLENLTNLNELPPIGTTLVMGILRLQHGSGSPAAVLALIP